MIWSRPFRAPALRWAAGGSRSLRTTAASSRGPRNSLRRREPPQPITNRRKRVITPEDVSSSRRQIPEDQLSGTAQELSSTLHETRPEDNTLLSPVHVPEDPNGVLTGQHPAARILANSALVVQRQLEMMNVMLGFEQANRYVILDASGNHVGYMAEQETGLANTLARQAFRTHRSFVAHIFDREGTEVLRFYRPFSWISSRIRVYDPLMYLDPRRPNTVKSVSSTALMDVTGGSAKISPLAISEMRVIGEAQQVWAPLRRKYDLFTFHESPYQETEMSTRSISSTGDGFSPSQQSQLAQASREENVDGEYHQFAYVNEPFLSWDFALRSADDRLIGSVNRNFVGFAREIFTDTGVYALRMDSAALAEERERGIPTAYSAKQTGMTLDQRAVMLATAVSIDFDYFSRHSHGIGFFPLWFPSELTSGGTAAGEVGAATAAGRTGQAGTAAEGVTAGAVGAGSMAGYEAMQRGIGGKPDGPAATEQYPQRYPEQDPRETSEDTPPQDFWGSGGDAGGGEGTTGGSDGFGWF